MLLTAVTIQDSLQNFARHSFVEWFGVFTGILCVWLAAKNIIWNWPIAILSVSVYIFIFYETKLYADMGLQFYFLAMNIYGWYYWGRKKNDNKEQRISLITGKQIVFSILGVIAFTAILGLTLYKNTDAAFPFVDSFCTASSLIAQIFLARKILQNWLIWIFVDVLYVGVYFSKGLYPTTGLYFIYIFIAIMGYLDWRKKYHEQTS